MTHSLVRVCFVCLGNICRSPTGEGVMRKLVAEAGLIDQIEIDSAGTAAYHVGERADVRSRRAARARGIELTSLARAFEASDFTRFDYVLAMDRENYEKLVALASDDRDRARIHLLRTFDPKAPADAEIADPYYGGDRGFEDVLDQCEAACQGLIETLRREHELAS